jgi:hypothetical protein
VFGQVVFPGAELDAADLAVCSTSFGREVMPEVK